MLENEGSYAAHRFPFDRRLYSLVVSIVCWCRLGLNSIHELTPFRGLVIDFQVQRFHLNQAVKTRLYLISDPQTLDKIENILEKKLILSSGRRFPALPSLRNPLHNVILIRLSHIMVNQTLYL